MENLGMLILIVIISIISFLILIYLLLPWIFRVFVSPKFNASYVYKKKDFKHVKKDIFEDSRYFSVNIKINHENGIFNIQFGKNDLLKNGSIKLRYDDKVVSNLSKNNQMKPELQLISIEKFEEKDFLGEHELFTLKFTLKNHDSPIIANIKYYFNENFLTFKITIPFEIKNENKKEISNLLVSFPTFENFSTCTKILTFRHVIFCPPAKNFKFTSSPVTFYDDRLNCFIISPLKDFLNLGFAKDKNGVIYCGVQGEIESLPVDYDQEFIMIFEKGINKAFEKLGEILLKYNRVKRKDLYSDVVTSYLGFWTDNGAYYYYKTEKSMNYEQTLIAIKKYFEKNKIPIKYYNFDSWWYLKHTNKFLTTIFRPIVRILGGGFYGNTMRWETDPQYFTMDLKTFYNKFFKMPICAHNRRWDARSPYLKQFEFITYKKNAVPISEDFWDWLMKNAKESGIIVYEQDWMNNQIKSIPFMRKNFFLKKFWLDSMAKSAKKHGVNVFYCMQTPELLLYSIYHENVTISRCSQDYNHRWPLTYRFVHGTQTNLLFNAIGINSHPDCFRTKSMEGIKRFFGEKYPFLKCLYQSLNGGIIAPGDKKEDVNWPLLRKTCKDDGLLLKPDKFLTVNDLMFKKHKKYYICNTYSSINGKRWHYVLAVNLWPRRVKETWFIPEELGFNEESYVAYDFLEQKAHLINKNNKIELGKLRKYDFRYYVLCPIFNNKISIIGCPDKFITASKTLIKSIELNSGKLEISVEYVIGSTIRFLVFSKVKINRIDIENMPLKDWKYDKTTFLAEMTIPFEKSRLKKLSIFLNK